MTPSEFADQIIAGTATRGCESDWLAALAELESRCLAKGIAIPDRSADPYDPEPLVRALTGQDTSTQAAEDASVTIARLTGELARTRQERDQARTAAEQAEAALVKLKADVAANTELTAAKAEVATLKSTIETMKRDHEAALTSLDYDVDQRAAAKIVQFGIREPKPDEAILTDTSGNLTERCKRAAAAKA